MGRRTGGFLKEVKYVDYEVNLPIQTTIVLGRINPTELTISGIKQGTSEKQRNGNKVMLTTVQIKGLVFPNILMNQADNARGCHIKIALLLDTQANSAQYTSAQVYQSTGDTALEVFAMRDIEFVERFQVLKEWHMNVSRYSGQTDGTNTASIAGDVRYFKCYKKINIPVRFVNVNETIADIMDNALHMYAISTEIGWNIKYISRVKFSG